MEKREHSPNIAADPDLEENGDADADPSDLEPSLGSNDNFANQEHWAKGNIFANDRDVDCEGEHDGRELDEEGDTKVGRWDNPATLNVR